MDVIRVQDVGLTGADDQGVLAWAADHNRIVLTHDRATMPRSAYERLKASQPMPGLFAFDDRLPVGRAIEELLLMGECTEQDEWSHLVVYPPL